MGASTQLGRRIDRMNLIDIGRYILTSIVFFYDSHRPTLFIIIITRWLNIKYNASLHNPNFFLDSAWNLGLTGSRFDLGWANSLPLIPRALVKGISLNHPTHHQFFIRPSLIFLHRNGDWRKATNVRSRPDLASFSWIKAHGLLLRNFFGLLNLISFTLLLFKDQCEFQN